ncbi:MAG: hypothetical protein H0W11_10655 [Gemmatimonadetes bacterium]|jgi:hypothetical protein|nr:hypothetical protein [Gemmatimonadota bacterium]
MKANTKRSLTLACTAVLLACGSEPQEQVPAPVEQQPAASAPATSPAMISLRDVAGRWIMRAWAEAGDSVPGYELVATADTVGWTRTFPGRSPVPVRVVAVAGDSIITQSAYESVLREGVPVTTRTVYRLRDGRLVGTLVARYQTTGPDSVLRIRTEGDRAP